MSLPMGDISMNGFRNKICPNQFQNNHYSCVIAWVINFLEFLIYLIAKYEIRLLLFHDLNALARQMRYLGNIYGIHNSGNLAVMRLSYNENMRNSSIISPRSMV